MSLFRLSVSGRKRRPSASQTLNLRCQSHADGKSRPRQSSCLCPVCGPTCLTLCPSSWCSARRHCWAACWSASRSPSPPPSATSAVERKPARAMMTMMATVASSHQLHHCSIAKSCPTKSPTDDVSSTTPGPDVVPSSLHNKSSPRTTPRLHFKGTSNEKSLFNIVVVFQT